MKKQTFIKGSLLLAIVSVITINVALCSNKNKQKLQLDSFNIEALTQGIDGYHAVEKLGPQATYYYQECDQRYVVYYVIRNNKKRYIDTQIGANVEIPYKTLMAGANASFNANWNKINDDEIVMQKFGGGKLIENTAATNCAGASGSCLEFDPCLFLSEQANITLNSFLSSLNSL